MAKSSVASLKAFRPFGFHVPIDPPRTTHQSTARICRRRDGTPFIARSTKGNSIKKTITLALKNHAPELPIDAPVAVTVWFVWNWLKGDPKYKRAKGIIPATGSSDADNLAKLVLDAMQDAKFYVNDNRVTDLTVRKRRGERVGLYVFVHKPLEEVDPMNLIELQNIKNHNHNTTTTNETQTHDNG